MDGFSLYEKKLDDDGREILDVHLAYTSGTTSNSSKGIIPGDGSIVPVKLTFANAGDASTNDMVAVFSTAVPTLMVDKRLLDIIYDILTELQ